MAAAGRKGKILSPTIPFGLLPHSGEPLSGGKLRLPQPHGTCSSGSESGGRSSAGIGRSLPYFPPPGPQDLSLRGRGGSKGESLRLGLGRPASKAALPPGGGKLGAGLRWPKLVAEPLCQSAAVLEPAEVSRFVSCGTGNRFTYHRLLI